MKTNSFLKILLIIPAITCFDANAQSPARDFKKISDTYLQMSELYIQTSYLYFKSNDAQPSEKLEGTTARSGGNFYFRAGDAEAVHTDKLSLFADHTNKLIVVKPRETTRLSGKDIFRYDIDSLLKAGLQIKEIKAAKDRRSYLILFEDPQYASFQIVFNTRTYFIEKMIFTMHDRQSKLPGATSRIEIRYHTLQSPPEPALFSTAKFIKAGGSAYSLAGAYKSYRLYQ